VVDGYVDGATEGSLEPDARAAATGEQVDDPSLFEPPGPESKL
jgi:hypothetical protein